MAREQKKKSPWHSIGRHHGGVTEFCQTGGHQRYFAATFQVRTNTHRFQQTVEAKKKKQNISLIFNCPSFFSLALASTSEPRGPESQPIPEGKAARWAPAQCTTWHTASTNLATNTESGVPPLTRSAHRDTDGGVDHFQSAESHWEWIRAGWSPCGASLTHKYTNSRLSSDGHERNFAGGEWKRNRGSRTESEGHLCSVPKFSKCLWLLPSVLQHSFV